MISNNGCEKWIEIADREAIGEPVSPEELSSLRAHESECRACADEAAAFRSLNSSPLEAVPSDEQVERILRAAGTLRPMSSPAVGRRASSRNVALGLGLCLAAAAATVLVVRARRAQPTELASGPAAQALSTPEARVLPSQAAEAEANLWRTTSAPSCRVVLDDVTLCLDAGSEARTDQLTGSHAVLNLLRGRAIASLAPRPPGASFAIQTAAANVRAVGTIFSVELDQQGTTVARVLRGEVAVQASAAREAEHLRAGHTLRVGTPNQTAPLTSDERKRDLALLPNEAANVEAEPTTDRPGTLRPSNEDPLARARSLRAHRQFAQAAALYESIHAANPQSSSGRAALLGLGELRLSDLHDAAGALRAFDAYLASGEGALAREAAYGRIRALRALGRIDQENAATSQFISAYPNGPEAQTLRQRLEAIRGR